jgi:hypothetical protein
MSERELEQVVIDFWERKFDVLVSTTIIETGIDIPNANTLIIDRAENFGVSAAAPDSWGEWVALANALMLTSSIRPTNRSPKPRTTVWPPSQPTTSSARACKSP